MTAFENLVVLLKKPSMVDLQWTLMTLATLTQGDHAYFQKDFVPPKRVKRAVAEELLDNRDGFFTGLPQAATSSRGRRNMFETAESRRQKEVERLQREEQALEARLMKKKAAVVEA